MKFPRYILAAALILGLAAIVVAWRVSTSLATTKTSRVLTQAEAVYVDSVDDCVDSVLIHAAACFVRENASRSAFTNQYLHDFASRFDVEEVNIVNTNGICVASTDSRVIGFDFAVNPETAAFLCLLEGTKYYDQSFRPGVGNSDCYRKYLGIPLTQGGFVQLGLDFSHVRAAQQLYDASSLLIWRVGRLGHYDVYDLNADGSCDYTADTLLDGEIRRCQCTVERSPLFGQTVYVRPFSYAGMHYCAVVPESEYFQQRDLIFWILVPVLVFVIAFFAWVLFLQLRSADRARKLRELKDASTRRELELARKIQQSVLPPLPPGVDAVCREARLVGGDFYDLIHLSDTRLAVVIADVSGKGIPAAMFMMRARNEIANALREEPTLSAAVSRANASLYANNDDSMFLTAWIGILDSSAHTLEYINAGHPTPYILTPTSSSLSSLHPPLFPRSPAGLAAPAAPGAPPLAFLAIHGKASPAPIGVAPVFS